MDVEGGSICINGTCAWTDGGGGAELMGQNVATSVQPVGLPTVRKYRTQSKYFTQRKRPWACRRHSSRRKNRRPSELVAESDAKHTHPPSANGKLQTLECLFRTDKHDAKLRERGEIRPFCGIGLSKRCSQGRPFVHFMLRRNNGRVPSTCDEGSLFSRR